MTAGRLFLTCLIFLGMYQFTEAEAQVFRYPEDTRPSSLLPFFADDMSSVRMTELIFEGLVFQNRRGDVEGALASSWKIDPGNRGIRFALRQGVKWHDGREFTAADVVFTVNAAKNPKTVFNGKGVYGFITDVRAEGKYAVYFGFNRPLSEPAKRFLFKIIPKHKFKGTAIKRQDRFSRRPVGTGPYKVSRFGSRMAELKTNGDYRDPARIPRVVMQHTPDKSAQVNLLQYSGGKAGVQAVIFLPPKNIPLFENSDSVVLEPYHTVSWWYMGYNHKNPALAIREVRDAIALAVDREELLEANLGRGDILSGPFTESSPFYNFEVELRNQDLGRANQLLETAGFKMRGGYRSKGRMKLEFDFVLDKELAEQQALFLGMQAQLKKIGVKLMPRYVDHAAYREQVFKRRKYDLTINIWSFEEVEDVYDLFHSKGAINFINYSNPEVDAILDKSKAAKDHKEYKALMMKLHGILNRELPYLFLWSLDIYSGISKRVRNIFIAPYYYFTSFKEWELRR